MLGTIKQLNVILAQELEAVKVYTPQLRIHSAWLELTRPSDITLNKQALCGRSSEGYQLSCMKKGWHLVKRVQCVRSGHRQGAEEGTKGD